MVEMLYPILLLKFTEFLEKDDDLLVESDYSTAIFYGGAMLGLSFSLHVFFSFTGIHEFKTEQNS